MMVEIANSKLGDPSRAHPSLQQHQVQRRMRLRKLHRRQIRSLMGDLDEEGLVVIQLRSLAG